MCVSVCVCVCVSEISHNNVRPKGRYIFFLIFYCYFLEEGGGGLVPTYAIFLSVAPVTPSMTSK